MCSTLLNSDRQADVAGEEPLRAQVREGRAGSCGWAGAWAAFIGPHRPREGLGLSGGIGGGPSGWLSSKGVTGSDVSFPNSSLAAVSHGE